MFVELMPRLFSLQWPALHPLGDFDSEQVQREAQGFIHSIDEVEKKPLPGRVRFAQDAIEPARLQKTSSRKRKARLEGATGEYKMVLDEMVAAMNASADTGSDVSSKAAERSTSAQTIVEQPDTAPAPKDVAA